MRYHVSETNKQDDLVEERLKALKEEYHSPRMSKQQLVELKKRMEDANMTDKKDFNKKRIVKYTAAAAAFIAAFVILPNTSETISYAMEQIPIIGQLVEAVTFREYEYNSKRNNADIEVSQIKPNEELEKSEVKENLERTTAEVNAEIEKITDELIEEFESQLENEMGYQDILVKSEVLSTAEDYFTLKLICYQAAGSGYEWNYFYTIDLNTGERQQLKDIFKDGADYITPISENIKEQMREQMEADDMVCYWLDEEVEEWNFKSITDETSFYLNEEDNVVISFNEGDVGPMSMGVVEFEIPAEVLCDIRK